MTYPLVGSCGRASGGVDGEGGPDGLVHRCWPDVCSATVGAPRCPGSQRGWHVRADDQHSGDLDVAGSSLLPAGARRG